MAQQFVDAPPLNAPVTKPVQPASPVAQTPSVPKTDTPSTPPTPSPEKLETPQVKSADILKRAVDKPQDKPALAADTNYREDLDKISDPAVRAVAEKALKDFESGYNKKFQTLAEQRRELESMQQKISTWTPQRLQEELRNPAFVQAMQVLQQQAPPNTFEGSADEWSALSPQEKQRMQAMEQEQRSLQSQLQQMRQKEEDFEIQKLYPEYDPKIVDEAIDGLRTGQITASRADIWKVVNHDKNVEKGYQFGFEDGYKKAVEKLNGSSLTPGGLNVTNADEVPEDIRKGGFSSIALWRLSRHKGGAKKQ